MNDDTPSALSAVRERIDQLDQRLVKLLCERQVLVQRASHFKEDEDAVRAPERVEEIIARVRELAEQEGGSTEIVESVYRSMIESFINFEMSEHRSSYSQDD